MEEQVRWSLLSWVHLIKYISTMETLNEKILGDVLDIGWVYYQAKFHFEILKHLGAMLLLVKSDIFSAI